MSRSVRRVVTGHDDDGNAVILVDGPTPNLLEFGAIPGLASTVPWLTRGPKIDLVTDNDPVAPGSAIPSFPGVGETILRVADFPPDTVYPSDARAAIFAGIHGSEEASARSNHVADKHFWFHKTDSLDYAVVLEGEITLIVDRGETVVRAGDVVVQRATSHAWSNRTGEVARVLFVLIGTPPVSPAEMAARRRTDADRVEQP